MKLETGKIWAADTESTQPDTSDIENDETMDLDEKRRAISERVKRARTHVWGVGFGLIGDNETFVVDRVEKFLDAVKEQHEPGTKTVVYFHNLAWDGMLILTMLYRDYHYTYVGKPWKAKRGELGTMITDDGRWYSLTVNWKGALIEMRDSLKIIPSTIDKMAKDFDLPIRKLKGSIDYTRHRGGDWKITKEEEEYIKHDVKILQLALEKVGKYGLLEHLTIGSAALDKLKELTPAYDQYFPVLPADVDDFCRRAYRGGWCYVNPEFQDRVIIMEGDGRVYDVNSLYPYSLHTAGGETYRHKYPVGMPIFDSPMSTEQVFDLMQEEDKVFFIKMKCTFKIKKGNFPFIQLKRTRFAETEYVADTGEDPVEIYLTSVDFLQMLKTYEMDIVGIERVMVFYGKEGIFDNYIDYYMKMKEEATIDKNKTKRQIAKLFLNNAYGKFGTNANANSAIFTYDPQTGQLIKSIVEDTKKTIYVPVAAFTTAYGRAITVNAANANFDNFCYADTDSIHLIHEVKPGTLEIHGTKLGAWDEESKENGNIKAARFVHQKCYIELYTNGMIAMRAGGCPEDVKKRLLYVVNPFEPLELDEDGNVTNARRDEMEILERYTHGLTESGKLLKTQVDGGYILTNTTFTIK